MKLQDSSRFFLELKKTDTGFTLTTKVDDLPLVSLYDTTVLYPYPNPKPSSSFLLTNEEGEIISEGSYHQENGTILFSIDAPGTYHIVEKELPTLSNTQQEEQKESFPSFLVFISSLLATGCFGLISLLRRWKL